MKKNYEDDVYREFLLDQLYFIILQQRCVIKSFEKKKKKLQKTKCTLKMCVLYKFNVHLKNNLELDGTNFRY